MTDYPEFDGIEEMSVDDRVVYLLQLRQRYNEVIAQATELLKADTESVERNGCSDPRVKLKSRNTTTVDNNMLRVAYPDLYEKLYIDGKLTAKAQDIKGEDNEAYDNVVTVKKSTWLEYKED